MTSLPPTPKPRPKAPPEPSGPTAGGQIGRPRASVDGAAGLGGGPSLGLSVAVHGALFASLYFASAFDHSEIEGGHEEHRASITVAAAPARPALPESTEEAPPPAELLPPVEPTVDAPDLNALAAEAEVWPLPEASAELPAPALPLGDPRRFESRTAELPDRPLHNRFLGRDTVAGPVLDAPVPPPMENTPAETQPADLTPPESTELDSEAPTDETTPPTALAGQCPPPSYPRLAQRRRWTGDVTVEIEVDEHGTVARVTVTRSSGQPVLDDAAVQAVSKWRFEPGRRNGLVTRLTVTKTFEFQLPGTRAGS